MKKVLIGLGIGSIAAAVAAGSFVLASRDAQVPSAAATAGSPILAEPMGPKRDQKDVGEQHYRHGRYPEALAYWEQRAGAGDAYAAYRLGVEYMDGKPGVVGRDYEKAIRYHKQAALAGYSLSMFDLGSLHEMGQGVAPNIADAAMWYGHSARYGLAQGQYNFATMLETGAGVAKDEVEAYKYFILAARGGFTGVPYNAGAKQIDRDAPLPTQLLEQRMSRAQVEEGRARADTFRPATGPLSL